MTRSYRPPPPPKRKRHARKTRTNFYVSPRPPYILARAARGGRGNRSAWLCIIGFAAVVFNFTVVNVYFPGLHSYSRRT